jgi:putative toxin-antitoxin system antitoxin component (TIGR02293 family)
MADIQPRSVAALLGIRPRTGAFTSLDLANEVGRGLSVLAVDRVCGMIAPAEPALRYKIVSRATLARRQRSATRRLSREESDRVARLARLWAFATDVWGSEEAARQFLAEPHPLLGGRVPRDVATETEIGARAVEDLLGRLKYGSAA